VLGHKRGKRNSRPNTSLLQLEGVDSKEAAQFYLGKVSRRFTGGEDGRRSGQEMDDEHRQDMSVW
jgi:ribosomal protein L35AE/L33A